MKFNINNTEIPINNISYHHKERNTSANQYELMISIDETKTVGILENFAEVSIKSKEFIHNLLIKDKQLGSIGIIWNLLINYLDINDENPKLPYYMLNSVDNVYMTEKDIVIKGKCE